MQLSIQQSEFNAALTRVKSAIANKSPQPILLCVKLSTDHGALRLDATDLEIAITTECPAMVEEDGAVAVPYALPAQVVGELPDERIAMALDPATLLLTLECGKYTTRIHCLAPVVGDDDRVLAAIPVKDWLATTNLVTFAAARDKSRPVLASVLIESVSGAIRMVAADGFRLAACTATIESPPDDLRLLVPVRAINALGGLIDKKVEGDVAIVQSGVKVQFVVGDHMLVSRTIIDGTFPDWERVVPTNMDQPCHRRARGVLAGD